jgi:hypothetical protein
MWRILILKLATDVFASGSAGNRPQPACRCAGNQLQTISNAAARVSSYISCHDVIHNSLDNQSWPVAVLLMTTSNLFLVVRITAKGQYFPESFVPSGCHSVAWTFQPSGTNQLCQVFCDVGIPDVTWVEVLVAAQAAHLCRSWQQQATHVLGHLARLPQFKQRWWW